MRCLFVSLTSKFYRPKCSICSCHFCNLLNGIKVFLFVFNLLHGSPRAIVLIPVGAKVMVGRRSPPILPRQHGPVLDAIAAFVQMIRVAGNLYKVACCVIEVGALTSFFQYLCGLLKQGGREGSALTHIIVRYNTLHPLCVCATKMHHILFGHKHTHAPVSPVLCTAHANMYTYSSACQHLWPDG